jgi:hypothetical protein
MNLQHFEYPFVVFKLETVLLMIYEHQASISLLKNDEVLKIYYQILVKLYKKFFTVFFGEV